ncbi:MAG: DUF4358 domain-containing protein [Clostridia bacterium]|nr:DUF4358 domain-containing protein [Clostridia bacterium]
MKNPVKRLLAGLLLAAVCLAMAGCGAPASDTPALSCQALADRVQAACEFAGLTDVPESYLEKHLLIDAADLEEWAMRRDTDGASPEMILVLKVKSGADQAAIRKAVEEYREERILQYRDYQPAQVFKLENSKVLQNGPLIALIVAPDAAKAVSALGGGWN